MTDMDKNYFYLWKNHQHLMFKAFVKNPFFRQVTITSKSSCTNMLLYSSFRFLYSFKSKVGNIIFLVYVPHNYELLTVSLLLVR